MSDRTLYNRISPSIHAGLPLDREVGAELLASLDRIGERNHYVFEAVDQHWAGSSIPVQAQNLSDALLRYATSAWPRVGQTAIRNPHPPTSLDAACWLIMKAKPLLLKPEGVEDILRHRRK